MLKSHEKFHSANGKRQVLVVDDELINRELMGIVLENDYEVLFAEDGRQAMDMVRENNETLSLVLLDLMMPIMSGKEVLRQIKADPATRQIPVIVLTADQKAEVEILNLGAADFIPKPYPEADVILARILRTIELSEDRQIIQSTERDQLTGLYNREYFYRYAEQFDQHHRNMPMDAIVVDINHFHMINERFGNAYGDEILRRIGEKLREMVGDSGGIVCRREADTFMVYCPHRNDYKAILDSATIGLAGDDSANNRVRLRMGVYAEVDKGMNIERRFDRAKMAADTVRNSFTKTIGLYDKTLHERELYAEQLIEDFPTAIHDHQFKVFYQPKFDVRPEIPVLASAEALVRWEHPTLGMINPGVFIPLFEENGLIQALDNYVWRTAAQQIREWKNRLGFAVPVSVNVSRIDMYDPHLVSTFQYILEDAGLEPHELLLEITESAYTQDSEQIIDVVNRLRTLGFSIEMDDFGTGYSSLNMISTLPVDALKLDMQFIRMAFSDRKDTRMLEVIIDIADYLSVPVIAEGVETEEQLQALKAMGCDMVQGYYFSRPVPPQEYEPFVMVRRDQLQQDDQQPPEEESPLGIRHRKADLGRIAYALSSGFECVYYVDIATDRYVKFSSEGSYDDLQIQRSGPDFFHAAQQVIFRTVHPDDQQRVSLCLEKQALLDQLVGPQPFSMTYRIRRDGESCYRALKVVRTHSAEGNHVVIGVSTINASSRRAEWQDGQANTLDFDSLAKALTSDMESIYYIDLETGTYSEFVSHGPYGTLGLRNSGANFFDECKTNTPKVVYSEDQEMVAGALEREHLLGIIEQRGTFSMDYRLVIKGRPLYYRLKAIPAEQNGYQHLIIGVSNVDAQLNDSQRIDAIRRSATTYSRIAQALAEDYFSIYYVDMDTNHFVEYNSHTHTARLDSNHTDEDFFGLCRANVEKNGHPEDVAEFLGAFTKEHVVHDLEQSGTYSYTLRMMFDDVPTYVNIKATRMVDTTDSHIVVGVSNVDAQMRREQEQVSALRSAREASYRDALTGVKSRRAYNEAQAQMDRDISAGTVDEFAVVLCDINDLKEVNDTQGHAAGDELLRAACRQICKIFTHSPVYRYGGDEFVALLRGHDYVNRALLVELLATKNRTNRQEGGPVIACGLADYLPERDTCLRAVFERADAAMYENKKELKRA